HTTHQHVDTALNLTTSTVILDSYSSLLITLLSLSLSFFFFFFFNDTATTEIYTLSLHDALPIHLAASDPANPYGTILPWPREEADRKSTRLNSSHLVISYAVFCLKKKKKHKKYI